MAPRIGLIAYGFDIEEAAGFEEVRSCDADAIGLQDALVDVARSCEGILVAYRDLTPDSLSDLATRTTPHGVVASGSLVVAVPVDDVDAVALEMPNWIESAGIA